MTTYIIMAVALGLLIAYLVRKRHKAHKPSSSELGQEKDKAQILEKEAQGRSQIFTMTPEVKVLKKKYTPKRRKGKTK